jgi:hypothetical protein
VGHRARAWACVGLGGMPWLDERARRQAGRGTGSGQRGHRRERQAQVHTAGGGGLLAWRPASCCCACVRTAGRVDESVAGRARGARRRPRAGAAALGAGRAGVGFGVCPFGARPRACSRGWGERMQVSRSPWACATRLSERPQRHCCTTHACCAPVMRQERRGPGAGSSGQPPRARRHAPAGRQANGASGRGAPHTPPRSLSPASHWVQLVADVQAVQLAEHGMQVLLLAQT